METVDTKAPQRHPRHAAGNDELKWVANTVTLIYGERDALLVDTFLSEAQTAELADWIAQSGKRLSTIYITHAHADHFFGLKLLRDRFPGASSVAAPQVADAMRLALAPEAVETWRRRHAAMAIRKSLCNGITRPLPFLAAQSGNSRTVPMAPM